MRRLRELHEIVYGWFRHYATPLFDTGPVQGGGYIVRFTEQPGENACIAFGDTTYAVRAAREGEEPTRRIDYEQWRLELEGVPVVLEPLMRNPIP